jgi:hypothetical protein
MSDQSIKSTKIFAVYGVIHLVTQNYLITVTEAEIKCEIADKQIYVAKKFEFIPMANLASLMSEKQDQPYIEMLQVWFKTGLFFFSYDYDLTSTLQVNLKNDNMGNYSASKTENCSKYFYNECHMRPFIDARIKDWIYPFVCGF